MGLHPIYKRSTSSKLKWTINGALFGLAFPIIAILIRINQYGLKDSYELFLSDPLLWIIMTAPLFLGAFACIAGAENDRVRLIQQNMELSNIQASKMASLGEMASGIAHEINNPLSVILGRASILQSKVEDLKVEGQGKEKIIEDLKKIEATVHRIAKIIKGLKSFSRNADNDPMVRVSLKNTIEDTLELCTEKFKNRSIELRIKLDPTKPLDVEGRPAQLSQVFLNLLSNSLDAVELLPEKWVEISFQESKGKVEISMIDSGNGIPPDTAEKMMQPFYTTKGVGKGTGLGLSISKGIIENHGGRFFYDSKSKNTCFKIELPLIQAKTK